jgi:hypothetical protein
MSKAFSSGGLDEKSNLATACCKCNVRKSSESSAPLDECAKRPQRKAIKARYGEPQHWDGLAALFVVLCGTRSRRTDRLRKRLAESAFMEWMAHLDRWSFRRPSDVRSFQ